MRRKNFNSTLKFDVFLSYHPKDQETAVSLANDLTDEGLSVWLDIWELKGEDKKDIRIKEGIRRSRSLLLLMSKNLFDENWINIERQTVYFRSLTETTRKFVPVLIETTNIPDNLKQYAFIDLRRKSNKAFSKLVLTIRPKSLKRKPTFAKPILKYSNTLKGHTELIRRVSISADSNFIASASNDNYIKIWDLKTGKLINNLHGHRGVIWAIGITPDNKKIISGSHDRTLRIWNVKTAKCIKILTESASFADLTISKNGKYALSVHENGEINIYDLIKEKKINTFICGPYSLSCVILSDDNKKIITGSQSNAIEIRDFRNGNLLTKLTGHNGTIQSLVITKDGKKLISGSSDATIKIWEIESGRCIATLEGHTGKVWSLVLTSNDANIISCSSDKTIRVWDYETGRCINVIEEHYFSVYDLEIDKTGSYLVSGSKDKTAKIWTLHQGHIKKNEDHGSVRYTNAKVLLVGDTGVGKSGLAIRLTKGKFESTISSDGVWATQLKLPHNENIDNIEREIWIWDFAGQPDYRLVHQLFMDETSLAILVFNPQNENPFEGLNQWTYELQRAARKPFKKLLAAARIDRGGLIVSKKDITNFSTHHGFSAFFETSANTGYGCDELYQGIINNIDWENIPWTSSPKIFQLLKKEIIQLKDEGKVLLRLSELKQQLDIRLGSETFTFEELLAVIGLLAGPGVVWHLEFGDFILLKPELINAYSAAVIRMVRAHPEEIGVISEEDVLAGNLDYQDMSRLSFADEQIVLRAMHQTFITHGLCLREPTEEGTLLVFPSYFKKERPILEQHPSIFVTYNFNGNLEDIYSTLIVRLHHTKAFRKDRLWKFAAEFKTERNKKIGILLRRLSESTGEISIYFETGISDDTKVTFIRYVHEHLKVKTMDIIRFRNYVCPHCQTPVENKKTAAERLKSGKQDIVCVSCEKRVPLVDLIEKKFSSEQMLVEVQKLSIEAGMSIDNESKELILLGHAFAISGEAGQIFRPTPNSDWGIDGEIEFKDEKGVASGHRLYLQLKSGDSYLRKRKEDGKEIFKVKKIRHLSYWKSQAYPVMLVIRNSENQIRWMNISDYLKKKKSEKTEIVFDGEPFTVLTLVQMRDKILYNKKI